MRIFGTVRTMGERIASSSILHCKCNGRDSTFVGLIQRITRDGIVRIGD